LIGEETDSEQTAFDLLSNIQQINPRRALLFDVDESLTFDEAVIFLSHARSIFSGRKLLLMTPSSRSACEHLIDITSVPAG
jgi:hypothetical protein